MQVLGVIPARLGSTRLPGKPLADIAGRPMVEWVYRAARAARRISRVVVATDSEQVAQAVAGFGGEALLTSPEHPSGTDRMAEVARRLPDFKVLVNIQGDEPLMRPEPLDALIDGFLAARPAAAAGTLVRPARSRAEIESPGTAKVVRSLDGHALYFSRSPIPFVRDGQEDRSRGLPPCWIHVGVYIYARDFLLAFGELLPGPLETAEKLEQLRVLEHGRRMMTVPTNAESRGVDTPQDLERVRAEVAERRLSPI